MRRGGCTAVLLAALVFAAGCGTQDTAGGGSSRGGDGSGADGRSKGPGASGLSWSYDRILDGSASLSELAAVADDDIWAYGDRRGTGLRSDSFLVHHDGTDWTEEPLPEAGGGDRAQYVRLDAVGSGEVWLTMTTDEGGTRTLRRDGTAWVPLARHPDGPVGALKAFAPDDVWAVVGDRVQHWDGTRWTPRPVPVGSVVALDGTATDDLWAVGSRGTGAIDDTAGESEYSQPVAVHWDGRAWRATEVPEYRFPEPVPPEPGASLGEVVALAEDDIRAYGLHSFNHGEVEDEPDTEAIRLRWDGTRWTDQPAAPGQCAERIPVLADGTDGLFLNGNWYLTADGECAKITRSRLPEKDGVTRASQQSLWLDELARLPGSDRVIGVGHVQVNQSGNPLSKAVVVSLKR